MSLQLLRDIVSGVLFVGSAFFFFAGSVGLVRFPDVYTRLHALTKSDNLGLGLLIAGLALQADSWMRVVKLILIWMFVIFASATACHLVANAAIDGGVHPWTRDDR
ncbi:MAG: monovalent cation/H(+) antiporter subunit G [Coriobacteriia bacterium]|nr:monovalent cation/H(+) antiporter subunit G [Coriobacteriia bacterium]